MMPTRRAMLSAGVVTAVLATFGSWSAAGEAKGAAAPPPVFVVAAAKKMAVALGDPAPSSAQYVLTRHQAAMYASSGGTGTTNQPVYLVVLTGHFKTGQVGPAPGTTVTGRFASEVLDAKNGRDTDFSIGSQRVPIRSLGLIGNLLPYMQRRATPACSAPDLRASAEFQGATGSQLGGVGVTNESTLPCALPATPSISLSWRGHPLAVRTTPFPPRWLVRMNTHWSHRVTVLAPHAGAQIILQWFNWCGAAPWSGTRGFDLTVNLRIPNQAIPVRATTTERILPPFCHARPKTGTGSTLRVSPFLAAS